MSLVIPSHALFLPPNVQHFTSIPSTLRVVGPSTRACSCREASAEGLLLGPEHRKKLENFHDAHSLLSLLVDYLELQ